MNSTLLVAQKVIFTEQPSPTTASIRGISVLNDSIAALSGANNTLLLTSNGGRNWKKQNLPFRDTMDFRDVHPFDKDRIALMSAGYPCRIYLLENGRWNRVYENTDSAAFLNSIYFRDSLHGLAFGDALNGYILVLRTLDGGKSWQRVPKGNLPEEVAGEHGFAASGSCITHDKSDYYIALQSGFLQSSDGWQWQFQATHKPFKGGRQGWYSISDNANGIIAVGGDYRLPNQGFPATLILDDDVWVSSSDRLSGYRSVVDCADHFPFCLAAGTNGVDLSTDGGNSWQKVSDLNLNTLQFIPASLIGWAASGSGKIYQFEIQIDK
jgi:photosystem II stability/assembly factor-like uncharacterized protein